MIFELNILFRIPRGYNQKCSYFHISNHFGHIVHIFIANIKSTKCSMKSILKPNKKTCALIRITANLSIYAEMVYNPWTNL